MSDSSRPVAVAEVITCGNVQTERPTESPHIPTDKELAGLRRHIRPDAYIELVENVVRRRGEALAAELAERAAMWGMP